MPEHRDEVSRLIDADRNVHVRYDAPQRGREWTDALASQVTRIMPQRVLVITAGSTDLVHALAGNIKELFVLDTAGSRLTGLPAGITPVWGDPEVMPLNYDVFDMVVCQDCMDLFDSALLLDESRRILRRGGYFLYAGRILPDEDVEGVYDELERHLNPLHNDYYLESDLKTFFELKGFEDAGMVVCEFRRDLQREREFYRGFFGESWSGAQALAELSEESRSVLQSQYGYDGNSVTELVCAGLFRRKDIPA